jgi:hypothetical protein
MLVGLGGNNGTTIAAGILANKQYVPVVLTHCVQQRPMQRGPLHPAADSLPCRYASRDALVS